MSARKRQTETDTERERERERKRERERERERERMSHFINLVDRISYVEHILSVCFIIFRKFPLRRGLVKKRLCV